jgi:hypothetical protein
VELDPSDMVSNISYFWGAQFDVVYNASLIDARPAGYQEGSIYDVNTGNWTPVDYTSVVEIEPGLVRVIVYWDTYPPLHGGDGINTSGGTLVNLRWRSDASNTGVTALNFTDKATGGFLILVKFEDGLDSEMLGVTWTNSSVTVQ